MNSSSSASSAKKYNIQLSTSPSYTFNNLSSSQKFFTYVTNAQPAPRCFVISSSILQTGDPQNLITKAAYKDLIDITNSALIQLKHKQSADPQIYLVILTQDKIYILNFNGTRILAHFPQESGMKDLPESADLLTYWTCCTSVSGSTLKSAKATPDFIVAANSYGSLFALSPKGYQNFNKQKIMTFQDKTPVVCLCSDKKNGILAAGNATGYVTFLKSITTTKFEKIQSLQLNKSSVPITSCGILNRGDNLFVLGDGLGKVYIVNCKDGVKAELLITIQAHQQCLNAMACHPTKSVFATVGEDSMVAVWGLSESNQVSLIFDYLLANKIPTGVQFAGESMTSLLISLFDSNNMAYFKELF